MFFPNQTAQNTALIVIDVINSCAHPKCEQPERKITFSKIREMVPHLDSFIRDYREKANSPIIFIKTTPWQKKYLPPNLNQLYTIPKCEYYSEDNSGFSEDFFGVCPLSQDNVFLKNTYDAFSNQELQGYLKQQGVTFLIITGIFTDGCVLSTVANGFSLGFNFIILKDLIETTDVPIRQELQKQLIKFTFPYMYGPTIDSQEFLSTW